MKEITAQIDEVRIIGAEHLQSLLPAPLLGRLRVIEVNDKNGTFRLVVLLISRTDWPRRIVNCHLSLAGDSRCGGFLRNEHCVELARFDPLYHPWRSTEHEVRAISASQFVASRSGFVRRLGVDLARPRRVLVAFPHFGSRRGRRCRRRRFRRRRSRWHERGRSGRF
jgi:hypothetical protein